MPTELPDSAKVLRNDVGKRMATALEAIAQGGGGGASVVQKTLAEYEALPTADKMNGSIYKITDKALIYCLDEEYHAVKEITSADYAQLTSDEKNNGTLYIITDEETTAADIEYTSGVSVADKIDDMTTFSTTEKRVGTWINGKPLYEKIITFTNSASSTSDYVQVEQIPNLAIATQLNWAFKRVTGNNIFWYTGSGASNPEIDTQYSNYKIAFRVLNGWLEYGFVGYAGHWLTDCYVRVQYTKTTD